MSGPPRPSLDEHCAPRLAETLRDAGHDVVAPLLLVHPGRHPRSRAGERALVQALVDRCARSAQRDVPLEDWL